MNLSLTKGFTVTRTMRVDLRIDAFNAFNHVNYNNPNTSIVSPDFGRILGSATPRTAQIGAGSAFEDDHPPMKYQ